MAAENGDVDARVREVLAGSLKVPAADVRDDARFEDAYEGDSMTALEIAARLEREFDLTIPDEAIPRLSSLRSVRELVLELGVLPSAVEA